MIRYGSCQGVKITRLALNFKVDYRASSLVILVQAFLDRGVFVAWICLRNASLQHGTVLTSCPEQEDHSNCKPQILAILSDASLSQDRLHFLFASSVRLQGSSRPLEA